jgi:hypothetical protein
MSVTIERLRYQGLIPIKGREFSFHYLVRASFWIHL